MKGHSLFLTLVLASASAQEPLLVQIETKTLDQDGAGQTVGSIDVEIINADFDRCNAQFGGRFARGGVNVFIVSESKYIIS